MTENRSPLLDSVAVTRHDTAVGRLSLAASDDALLYCGFAPVDVAQRLLSRVARHCTDDPSTIRPGRRAVLEQAQAEIDAYLAGERRTFSVPLDPRLASDFTREVLRAVDGQVGYGRTSTYAQIAAAIGRPGAARAVGVALGSNPLCLVLPCHRVIGAHGRLTGYAGGIPAKQFLLDLEARPSASVAAERRWEKARKSTGPSMPAGGN
ncbi:MULTISPECIES: methylated-DNA--[protein]-cysteine S-methyltransferase [Streptomyces]|uniref:Methylated-DNA--[protein]-cysteine S-methyltransferase n=1 Tax=Streptomyces luteosporeus TaxID=173856 RepID=A0ABP6G436_9ACTN